MDEAAGLAPFNFKQAITEMVQREASDLHLKVGRPPTVRIAGELMQLAQTPLKPEELKALAEQLMTPRQVKEFDSPEVTEKKQLLYRRRLEALEQRLERLREQAMASPQHSQSPAPLAQQGADDGPTELLPSGARTGT